jgi:hypothetical protein
MPRVAYISCDSREWHDIGERMRTMAAWEPVYWICESKVRPLLDARFPSVVTHLRHDAYHMITPPALEPLELEPLDEPFLRDMSEAQTIALKMMDVMDSVDAFDFNARRRHFHQRLQYWRAIIKVTRPDVCVFAFSAHAVYDYVVYVLCRYYGIRTIMFETTFNWALYLAMEDPMVGSTEIRDAYAGLLARDTGGEIELPALYETYLSRLRGNYGDAQPWYMRQQFESFPKEIVSTLYTGKDRRRDHIGSSDSFAGVAKHHPAERRSWRRYFRQ